MTVLIQKRANYSQQDRRDHETCLSLSPWGPFPYGGRSCCAGRLPGFSLALSTFLLWAEEGDARKVLIRDTV